MKRLIGKLAQVLGMFALVFGCGGQGPQGPQGTPGPAGPNGSTVGVFDVLDFGAKADDPSFDNTASFQAALNAAAQARGGTVIVPTGRYFFDGNLSLPGTVTLMGVAPGPFWPTSDPVTTTGGPTLLPRSTTGTAFISTAQSTFEPNGSNTAVANLIFDYPNQVKPDAPEAANGPTVYPPTILATPGTAGFRVYGCTFMNSYDAIQLLTGNAYLENLNIGAAHVAIYIDKSYDWIHLAHIEVNAFWDAALVFPQPLDNWVYQNGIGLISLRCDGLVLEDFTLYARSTCIIFDDSPDGNTNGKGSDVHCDSVLTGILAKSLNYFYGFTFANLVIGGRGGGLVDKSIFSMPTGGKTPPKIVVEGGGAAGDFQTPFDIQSGVLRIQDMIGVNPIGPLPAWKIPVPVLPSPGQQYTSMMPTDAQVFVNGGSVQAVSINGQVTGQTSGMFLLAPGQSISINYTVAPTWTWSLE